MLVSILLLVSLGQNEGVGCLFDGILTLAVEFSSSQDGIGEYGDLRVGVDGVTAMAKLERGHLGGGIGCIIARELSSRQERVPVILAIADIGMEHVFKGAVGTFSLAIGLQVESCGHH